MYLREMGWGAWAGLFWLRIGTRGGFFKCGTEPMGSIKCGKFLDYLRACKLLRKYSATWS
jgi:hypothetical protein